MFDIVIIFDLSSCRDLNKILVTNLCSSSYSSNMVRIPLRNLFNLSFLSLYRSTSSAVEIN